jgi:predicted ATP-dependent endonuclease of OLD family
MRLVRLEIENYRSIQSQSGEEAITFGGRDCLIGKNNAGKSNILEAISYLLDKETISGDHYYKRDKSRTIEVTGFFRVEESDIARLTEDEYEAVASFILDGSVIGIHRETDDSDLEIIGLYPREERLRKAAFDQFLEAAWATKDGRADFRDKMLEQYPELEGYLTEDKKKNKTEWPRAYGRFVEARPEGIELVQAAASPERDVSRVIDKLLPTPIVVPAVKEVSDATKTSSTGEFGALLNKLSEEVEEELDEAIGQAMENVYRRLNLVFDEETGQKTDERHAGVRALEDRISSYLTETFQELSVLLRFPNPESRVMFSNAQVLIQEPGLGQIQVECVGEGVKRVLVFSLIRTLADLRQGKLEVTESQNKDADAIEEEETPPKPLIILYEEAELFLHPGMQHVLLGAFADLEEAGDQVIFTTHSPFMLQADLSTINLVRKHADCGTQVIGFHAVLAQEDSSTRNRLLQIQNVSSYLFADRVLLVEGVSDRIVLRKLAPKLKPGWDFEQCGIPVLPVTGKGDLPLFKSFLESLEIAPFIVTDIDAVRTTIERLCTGDGQEAIKQAKNRLCEHARELAEMGEFQPRINKGYAEKLASGYRWRDVFNNLEDLYSALTEGGEYTDEHLGCFEKLLLKRYDDAKRTALQCDRDSICDLRRELKSLLLGEGVLLLSGDIEDYYPSGSSTAKVKSALAFDPEEHEPEEIRACFVALGDTTDVEAFFHRLFEVE